MNGSTRQQDGGLSFIQSTTHFYLCVSFCMKRIMSIYTDIVVLNIEWMTHKHFSWYSDSSDKILSFYTKRPLIFYLFYIHESKVLMTFIVVLFFFMKMKRLIRPIVRLSEIGTIIKSVLFIFFVDVKEFKN